MAPPSTPAQPRFLLPKRQAPPQAQKQNAAPPQGGPHQFASTPRFNAPAAAKTTTTATPRQSSSHQPPLLLSTPGPSTARPGATQPRDAIDSSPVWSGLSEEDEERQEKHPLSDSIEIEESPSASGALPPGGDERPPKRRRVSISPAVDGSSEVDVADDPMMVDDEPMVISSSSSAVADDIDAVRNPEVPPENHYATVLDSERPPPYEPSTRHHHPPTFRPAPRFKAPEPPGLGSHPRRATPLPEAFSPQRRGAKYVAGGLAAEVRDWLVQVKSAAEYDRPAEGASVRAAVDGVRAGDGMWIVAGHHPATGAGAESGTEVDGGPARIILAGDGRIAAGLGGRKTVREGGTVAMYQPLWDAHLGDLGRFAVACDWEVEDRE